MTSVIKSAIKWRQRFREIEGSGIPDECVIHLQYESLLLDRHAASEMVMRRLGIDDLEISKKIEDYHSLIGTRQRPLHTNVTSGVIRGNLDSWNRELGNHELRLYQTLAGHDLTRHGYEIVPVNSSLVENFTYPVFVLRDVVAYLLGLASRVYTAVFKKRNVRERFRTFFSIPNQRHDW